MAAQKKIKIDPRLVGIIAILVVLIFLVAVISRSCGENQMQQVREEEQVSNVNAPAYTIEMDAEFFTSKKENNEERISAILDSQAYMTVYHVDNMTYTDCLDDLMAQTTLEITEKEIKIEGIEKSLGFRYSTGSTENDFITTVYTVDDGNNRCFVIRYVNMVKEEESIGAKFAAMAETFMVG